MGVTRIEPDTGEQKPIGIKGNVAPLEIDDEGLVWAIDNRRVFSVDRATGAGTRPCTRGPRGAVRERRSAQGATSRLTWIRARE